MLKKEQILSYLRDPEERNIVAKVIDKIEATIRAHEPQVLDFYDPYQRHLIDRVLPGNLGVGYFWAGGFVDAERQRLIIFPDYMSAEEIDQGLAFFNIKANLKFMELSHRDYLGAILGLGIKREKVGDLFPVEDGCQIIVDFAISPFIVMHLKKIHRVKVEVQQIRAEALVLPEEKVKEIKTTVSSMRLDVVASAGFGLSRSEAVKDIESEKLKLNWGVCTDSSRKVKENDVISIRGQGRIKVEEIYGETRKGRVSILLKKYV